LRSTTRPLLGQRTLHAFGRITRPLLRHPMTNVVLGLGLLVTGLVELVEGAFEEIETVIDAYHGVVLFGLVTALRGLLELLEAAEIFAIGDREFEEAQTAERRLDAERSKPS
jgi:hypothetical protein